MITEEEKQEIIDAAVDAAVEKALLLIPEVTGNMMANFATLRETNKKFWDKYPEFVKDKDTAKIVIEETEAKNPLWSHERILEKAAIEIPKRIDTLKKLDLDTISVNPSRQFESIESPSDKNPHGEI